MDSGFHIYSRSEKHDEPREPGYQFSLHYQFDMKAKTFTMGASKYSFTDDRSSSSISTGQGNGTFVIEDGHMIIKWEKKHVDGGGSMIGPSLHVPEFGSDSPLEVDAHGVIRGMGHKKWSLDGHSGWQHKYAEKEG